MGLGRSVSDVFFFSSRRRHTRSLRDWSSDVCSSDLVLLRWLREQNLQSDDIYGDERVRKLIADEIKKNSRSEERRVGKECRSRWPPDHYKKKHDARGRGKPPTARRSHDLQGGHRQAR